MRKNGFGKVETLNGYIYTLAGKGQSGVMANELDNVLPAAASKFHHDYQSDVTII